jgi:hypothetical protein
MDSDTITCPQCPSTATEITSVFVTSGEYSIAHDSYEAEGSARAYRCNGDRQHTFAIDVPIAESEIDEHDAECAEIAA